MRESTFAKPKAGPVEDLGIDPGGACPRARWSFLTESVYKVVLRKSIPAQIRQLILHHYQYNE